MNPRSLPTVATRTINGDVIRTQDHVCATCGRPWGSYRAADACCRDD